MKTIKKICQKVKREFIPPTTDRDKKYWKNVADKDIETVMGRICYNNSKQEFETIKSSIVFATNFPLDKKMKILDLGCGLGRTCKWFAPRVEQYYGVDYINKMIEKATKYNKDFKNAHFFTNNGKNLQLFEADKFDLVFSEIAFQHMKKPTQKSYINEVHRILKKHGTFIVDMPSLGFFKDKSYARTENELPKLFKKYKKLEIKNTKAYFLITAKK